MSNEKLNKSAIANSNKGADFWARTFPAAKETQALTANELQSEERRRFLRNAGRVATSLFGAAAMLEGLDVVGFSPDAGVKLALDAKEKSPQATRKEIETEIFTNVRNERMKAVGGVVAMVLGYLAYFKTGELEYKDDPRRKNPQAQNPS